MDVYIGNTLSFDIDLLMRYDFVVVIISVSLTLAHDRPCVSRVTMKDVG